MFDQIFNMVNIGIVVLDRDLRVIQWNKWMEAHSGISCDKIAGTSIFDNFPDLNSRIFQRNVKSVLAFGNFYYFTQKLHQYLFPFKPVLSIGSSCEFMQQSCVMGPLYDTNNNITNLYIMVQDVSVVTNLISDLEISKRNAELASKHKSEFLANMSHELRTPLNSLLVLAKLLQDNKSKNLTGNTIKDKN